MTAIALLCDRILSDLKRGGGCQAIVTGAMGALPVILFVFPTIWFGPVKLLDSQLVDNIRPKRSSVLYTL